MSDERTELEKRNLLRLSNEESNRVTRECIETSLINLLADNEIDKIPISEIVKKAGVSRTAFYRNYTSKQDVLASRANEMINEINRIGWRAITERDPHIIYKTVFSKVKKDAKQFSLLLKAGLLDRELMDIRGFLLLNYPDLDLQIHYILYGWSGMIKNIVLSWYFGGMKEDVDFMSELCCDLSEGIVRQIESIEPDFSEMIAAKVE